MEFSKSLSVRDYICAFSEINVIDVCVICKIYFRNVKVNIPTKSLPTFESVLVSGCKEYMNWCLRVTLNVCNL